MTKRSWYLGPRIFDRLVGRALHRLVVEVGDDVVAITPAWPRGLVDRRHP
jgi:hypothetical protein